MAKSFVVRAAAAAANATEPIELTARVQNAIDAIKKPFNEYARGFAALEMKRGDLAPKFMKAFGLWQSETGKTFVEFVRFLNPDIGSTRAEYRAHPVYQAADYLRRKQGAASRPGVTEDEAGTEQVRAETPMVVLERIIKSLEGKIPEAQFTKIFEIIKTECNWPEDRIETLKSRVEEVDPLVEIRGRQLDRLQLSMPERTEVAA